MTNGEKMQAAFPDIEMWGESKDTLDYSLGGMIHRVTKRWWNAEYKEPTTPNDCETCIHNKGVLECDMYGCIYEPTTKGNLGVDAVSRNAVINQIFYSADNNGDVVLGSALRERIARLPSVTQEPRKGHWIVAKGSLMGRRNACCSNCKDFYTNDWEYMNYCPNCGADMREVEE